MNIPNFLKLDGEALLYNKQDDSEFVFYISEKFFDNNSNSSIAQIVGEYVTTLGLCNWAIIDKNGKVGELHTFCFPTMFMCKPYKIEKVKNLVLGNLDADDYRLLRFKYGDQVVSQIHVPKNIDNVLLFYKLAVITAKIPTTIPYDQIWSLFDENMELNGNKYGLHSQLFGIIVGGLYRDPKDISRPFRFTDMKNMNNYKPISIKMIPNFISPFTATISEGMDEGLMSAIMMKDIPEDKLASTPMERILTQ